MQTQWACFSDPTGIHTTPVDDALEHILNGDACICGPTPECLTGRDGQDVWHYIHHSLDGRERVG